MAKRQKQVDPRTSPQTRQPIKYLTENGFSIIRLSEIDPSVINTPQECHFLVQYEEQSAHEISVGFDAELITQLQIRRRMALTETSMFWLVCAENCLATYLWEKNDYPPDGRLFINALSPDELMLAIHWRDRENIDGDY